MHNLFQIVALARRGNNEQSFVAIDQFEFLQSDVCDFEPKEAWPTTAAPPTTTTTTEKKPEHWLECTFQEGLCGWELSGAIDQDMFYWNRTNGKELEQNELIGPISDHNQEQNGEHKMFLIVSFFPKVRIPMSHFNFTRFFDRRKMNTKYS